MKKVLIGLGMALVLALGGVGVANLAAGADHSDSGRHQAPESDERGRPESPGKSGDHRDGQSGTEHAAQMRDFAKAHRDGMRAWQRCHRSGASDCQKPIPPGWAKHPDKHHGGWPPKQGHPDKAGKPDKEDKRDKADKA